VTRRFMLAVAVVLLASCAGHPHDSGNAAAVPVALAKDGKICTDEYPVGSHIPKQVCRTPEEIEAQQADAQALSRRGIESGNPKAGH
jgi:hypothetical protein